MKAARKLLFRFPLLVLALFTISCSVELEHILPGIKADVKVSASLSSVTEGSSTVISFALDEPNKKDIVISIGVVDGTTSGSDYTALPSDFTIAAGNTAANFTFNTIDDAFFEFTEGVSLVLSPPEGKKVTLDSTIISLSILDNDFAPAVSVADAVANEGSAASFVVSLDAASGVPVVFDYATSNNTAATPGDYSSTSGTITLAPGVTLATISVPHLGDSLYEGVDEDYVVTLSNLSNLAVGDLVAQGTIIDVDTAPILTINDISVSESGPNAAILTVTSNKSNGLNITVDYATSDGTATSGGFIDYTTSNGTLTIAAGNTTALLTVPIVQDLYDEDDETLTVTLSNPGGATIGDATGVVTITDDDAPPELNIVADAQAMEGSPITFSVSHSQRSEKEIVFNYSTVDGTALAGGGTPDYVSANSNLTILAGTAATINSTFAITTIVSVPTCEPQELFTLNLDAISNATNGTNVSRSGIILADDVPSIDMGTASITEGSNAVISVALSFSCPVDMSFDYFTADGTASAGKDYTYSTGSVTISAGNSISSLTFPTLDDVVTETRESFFIGVSNTIFSKSGKLGSVFLLDDDAGEGVAKVSVSDKFSCALGTQGLVKCWGDSNLGVLGQSGIGIGDEPGEMGDNLPTFDFGAVDTVSKVISGFDFNCVLLTNGKVKCWGNNNYSALGQGDSADYGPSIRNPTSSLPDINIGTGFIAIDIASTKAAVCVLRNDFSVVCWGENSVLGKGVSSGTTGDIPGEMGDNLVPVNLGTGHTAKAIRGGDGRFCAILNDDRLKCWGGGILGYGDSDKRGDNPGEMGDNLPYVDLGAGRTVKDVSVGIYYHHICAILDNDKVKCWGNNDNGRLGLENALSYGGAPGEMGDNLPYVELGTGYIASKIEVGYYSTCARVSIDSGVTYMAKCWGNASYGNIPSSAGGNPGEMGDNLAFMDLGPIDTITDFSNATSGWCFLLTNGAVKCGGRSDLGSHGNESTINSNYTDPATINLGTGRTAKALIKQNHNPAGSSIGHSVCAILDNDLLKCWGGAAGGRVGFNLHAGDQVGEMGSNLPLVNLGTSKLAVDIVTSEATNCALIDDGNVRCWGFNFSDDSLGRSNGSDAGYEPNQMGDNLVDVSLGTGRTAVSLAITSRSYETTVCAILDNFGVKCWGDGNYGARGTESTDDAGNSASNMGDNLAYANLGTNRKALQIVAGDRSFCALLDDQGIKCWGYNDRGRLGNYFSFSQGNDPGEMGDALPYVNLGTGKKATKVIAARETACALLTTGEIKCWGSNNRGANGNGISTGIHYGDSPGEMGDALPIVNLGTGRTALNIWAGNGSDSICVLRDDNTTVCWGYNATGQLGVGSTSTVGGGALTMGDNLVPTDLGTSRTPLQISTGVSHSCAVLDDASLKCWGSNQFGQCGFGNTIDKGSSPGQMGDLLPVVQTDLENL